MFTFGKNQKKTLKTLYIHGLDSFPVPEKTEILKNAGLDVVAPHLDYRKQTDAYQIVKSLAIENQVKFVIGSSLGGYVAFWLAEDLGIPCLLYNPAMTYQRLFGKYLPPIAHRLCQERYVVIGSMDETVNPIKNRKFFQKLDTTDCHQRVIVCEWLSHQIDFKTFEETVCWALKSHQLMTGKSN